MTDRSVGSTDGMSVVDLAALHGSFRDALQAQVLEAVDGREAGADRLLRGATAFLDGCLAQGTTKCLLVQARHEPLLRGLAAERDATFTALAAPDLEALGHPDPAAAALLVAMVAAVADAEASRGRAPELRGALEAWVVGPGATGAAGDPRGRAGVRRSRSRR